MYSILLEKLLEQLNYDAREIAEKMGKEALPILLKRKNAKSARERVLVLECLAKIKGEEAVQALIEALDDPEEDVWNTALDLLYIANSPAFISSLSSFVCESPNAVIRGEVAKILGVMGAFSSLSIIKAQLAKEKDEEAAYKMILAVAKMEDGPERKKVLENLNHEDPRIRYETIRHLEYINDGKLAKNLLPLLNDKTKVANIGFVQKPIWQRICDRALEAIVFLTGKTLPFETGDKVYDEDQLRMARGLISSG